MTFVKYSTPSFLAFLPIPFIFGSVGGGEATPPGFEQGFSRKAKLYEWARTAFRWIGEQDPFLRIMVKRAHTIRATTEETATRLRQLGAGQIQVVPAIGLLSEQIEKLGQYPFPHNHHNQPIRFVSIGRLLHWKGFHLGLKAFAQAGLSDAEFWVIGEGPELSSLQRQVHQDGIAAQVNFLGRLSRTETFKQLGDCHVLVHPSLHDSGGWVCLEAMAAGRPVICLDTGGPALQVTEQTGFKIPVDCPDQAIKAMSAAMKLAARDHALRLQMGQAGRERVRGHFSWSTIGQQLDDLYQSTAQKNATNTSTKQSITA